MMISKALPQSSLWIHLINKFFKNFSSRILILADFYSLAKSCYDTNDVQVPKHIWGNYIKLASVIFRHQTIVPFILSSNIVCCFPYTLHLTPQFSTPCYIKLEWRLRGTLTEGPGVDIRASNELEHDSRLPRPWSINCSRHTQVKKRRVHKKVNKFVMKMAIGYIQMPW